MQGGVVNISTLPRTASLYSTNHFKLRADMYIEKHRSQLLQASTNYKEAFALFDKRGNGRVALESLGDLLRACGQNPTLAEIRDLEKSVGGDCELPPFIKPRNTYRGRKGR